MSKTLLLADDSVTIQKVVGITFASEDVELVTVDNGDDALTRAREIRPDLVLADVSMPGLDGYELCHAIKGDALLSGTPVVLLTGTFEVQDESRAAQVGADAQIAKPFEAQALVDLVRGLIGAGQTPSAAPVLPPEPAVAERPEPVHDETPVPMAATPSPALTPAPEMPRPLTPAEPQQAPEIPVGEQTFEPTPEPMLDAEPVMEPEPVLEATPEPEPILDAVPEPAAPPAEPVLEATPEPEAPPAFAAPLSPPASMEATPPSPPARDLTAPPLDPKPQAEAPAEDTDFSFSDLEFAKSATTGQAPDATQVMSGIPPLGAEPGTDLSEPPSLGEAPAEDEPLSLDPLEPEAPQAPTVPQSLAPEAPAPGSMTEPRLAPDDSMREDADGIPEIEMTDPVEPDLAFDKTSLIEPGAAREVLASSGSDSIPEEPIAPQEVPGGWQPRAPAELAPDPSSIDADSQPVLASAISSETLDAPAEVTPLGERTMGGSEIFGDPLCSTDQSMGTTIDEQTEPEVAPMPAAPRLDAADAQTMRENIEKLAWDAFGPMSEQLVREVVKKIEEIAWDVVPQLAEKIVQEEIRRLTRPDDSDR